MKAIYPGTFDPITHGHTDIVKRAAHLFDEVVVAVAKSHGKNPLFNLDERIGLAETVLQDLPKVKVCGFSGLLADFVREQQALVVVRGLRAVTDFEYEFQLAGMNSELMPEVETVFLRTDTRYTYISATLVREVALLNGDVSPFVAPPVLEALKSR